MLLVDKRCLQLDLVGADRIVPIASVAASNDLDALSIGVGMGPAHCSTEPHGLKYHRGSLHRWMKRGASRDPADVKHQNGD
jgi:hypothetical protein